MQIHGPASPVHNLRGRRCDWETFEEINDTLSSSRYLSTAICGVDKRLWEHYTVSSILQEIRSVPDATWAAETRKKVLGYGALSQCLTVGALTELRKTADAAAVAEQEMKLIARKERLRILEEKEKRKDATRIMKEEVRIRRAVLQAEMEAHRARETQNACHRHSQNSIAHRSTSQSLTRYCI